jgi:uncharacterized membrane protein (UPF0127 family)
MRTLRDVARRSVLLVVGLTVWLGACDQEPAERLPAGAVAPTTFQPAPSTPAPPTSSPVAPEGFELVQARVTAADGEVCELCVWLADQPELRRRGLMGVTDLGDGAAMAFVYPRPTTTSFWMRDTLLPLSIAFFDADGSFLDSFDMTPCTTRTCPNYPTPPQFTVALEVPQGRLGELLVEAGSTLELLDLACET